MSNEQQRHDISDKVWKLLEPHLPGQRGQWGGIAKDNRNLSTACFGLYAPEPRGETYRRAMGNGAVYISGSADGGIRASGKNCWKFWWMSRILNGS